MWAEGSKTLSPKPLRVFLSLAGLALLTFAAHGLHHINATTAGFGYLLLVLVVAGTWGFVEACIDAMAHEFKTPLASIKAATTSLLADPQQLNAGQLELLNIADEDADHLKELIDDTVEMARLNTTHIEINPELSDIMEAIHEAVHSLRTELEGRHVEISRDGAIGKSAFDRRLLRLAIKQLIDNAAKYSPASFPIEIRVDQIDKRIRVDITDHGKGIPDREQLQIFDRFFRSPSIRNQIPGSGLGLSIASSLRNAMLTTSR
jgi:signal transduction histidine kinase